METNELNTAQNKQSLLDHGAFEKYFGGVDRGVAVGIYVRTANLFLKNIDERLLSLKTALTDYDNQGAIVVAHQIKGSLLSLGGNSLADRFRQIEMSVNLMPNTEILTLLEATKSDLVLFSAELKSWINQLETSH